MYNAIRIEYGLKTWENDKGQECRNTYAKLANGSVYKWKHICLVDAFDAHRAVLNKYIALRRVAKSNSLKGAVVKLNRKAWIKVS